MKLKQGATYKLIAALMASIFINGLAISVAHAANEISRLVPFQARLHGTDNKAVADGVQNLTFNIYDTPTGGTPVWSESHNSVSVIHGYVNVLLGAINPMHETNYAVATTSPAYDASKSSVDFTKQKFLGISIGGGVEMFPRSQLVPSFHAFTANHADHATQADNADKLGNKAANTYAQVSDVNAADSVLNQRITDEVASLDGDTDALATRATNLEAKFTGIKAKDADLLDGKNSTYYATDTRMLTTENKFTSSKAKDADKLDGLNSSDFLRSNAKAVDSDKLDNINSSQFARTDTAAGSEVFDNHVDFRGSLSAGNSGKGDAYINFHDDNSNTERTLKWDDGNNRFEMELNNSAITPVGGGLRTLYSNNTGNRYITETAANTTDWGTGLYIVITKGHATGYTLSSVIMIHDQNTTVYAPMTAGGWLWRDATGQWSSMENSSWAANILRIYKVMSPIY